MSIRLKNTYAYILLLIIILFTNNFLFAHYQDIIINNTLLDFGSYMCAQRYDVIKKYIFDKYQRIFTVLDLGASEGYFSFRAAHDYKAVCVMIEGTYAAQSKEETADILEDLCQENSSLDTVMLLKKHVSVADLKCLEETEHFDVVLALNFISHFGTKWKEALDCILTMGNHVIIETPLSNNTSQSNPIFKNIEEYLKTKNGIVLGEFTNNYNRSTPLSIMYAFFCDKHLPIRFTCDNLAPKNYSQRYKLFSTCQTKQVFDILTNQIYPWPMGIKLSNFTSLNGTVPSSADIANQLSAIDDTASFVISGKTISRVLEYYNFNKK